MSTREVNNGNLSTETRAEWEIKMNRYGRSLDKSEEKRLKQYEHVHDYGELNARNNMTEEGCKTSVLLCVKFNHTPALV